MDIVDAENGMGIGNDENDTSRVNSGPEEVLRRAAKEAAAFGKEGLRSREGRKRSLTGLAPRIRKKKGKKKASPNPLARVKKGRARCVSEPSPPSESLLAMLASAEEAPAPSSRAKIKRLSSMDIIPSSTSKSARRASRPKKKSANAGKRRSAAILDAVI